MRNKYWFIVVILLFILSCKRDSSSQPQEFTKDSYPLDIGNWWKYQLSDCSGGIAADTFILRVVSIVNTSSYIEYMCNFEGNGMTISAGYFLQSDTSLSFTNTSSNPSNSPFPDFHLKFPAFKGQYWPGTYPPKDSILVLGVENKYSSYGHTYGPCFSLNESYILPHNFLVKSMLLTPKIGLISGSINFQSDTASLYVCHSLLLLDYNVQ